MKKVLITGALGQIGTELIDALIKLYGRESVIATDLKELETSDFIYHQLDVTDRGAFVELCEKYQINEIYHLAALLSAVGEDRPDLLWHVNMDGLKIALDIARDRKAKIFVPSSIAAFGLDTPQDGTPQITIQRPSTIYGISKVAGELLCDYYHYKYGVDARGVRFPGIISNRTLPGGGTTDYAVHIYYEALRSKKYTCYLDENAYLDMVYMPDAIKAILDLMAADPAELNNRNAYNITAMSIAPKDIAASIKKIIPEFEVSYEVDAKRQAIADSWPNSLDDSAARSEWQWQPDYDLDAMTKDMLEVLAKKL